MHRKNKRHLGRILLDGGFISPDDLNRALQEQNKTSQLLGQILVSKDIISAGELNAVLSIQDHVDSPASAVRLAAGVRKTLGNLLLQAGCITPEQLEQAVAEQARTSEKLGVIFVRFGLLSQQHLDNILDFQRRQTQADDHPDNVRLGELLIAAGHITREQLRDALCNQNLSGRKLGEVLVEKGYTVPHHISQGLRIQHMLITSVLVAAISLGGMSGCGGSGGAGQSTTSPLSVQAEKIGLSADTSKEFDLLSCEQTSSSDMQVIHVPAGLYTVSKTIELPSNTVLEGEGDATVLLLGDEFNGSRFITNEDFFHGNKNIVLRNMQIRFNGPQLNGDAIGILRFYKVENMVISNVNIAVDSPMYAIDLSGQVRNATIEDCTISNANKGSGGAIMIRNSDPLPASATSHIILRGNRITSASDEPIAAFGWEGLVENIRIESNEVQADGASFGITAYGHNSPIQSGRINGVEIVGNRITGGNHGAIGVMGGAEDVSVIGNQVKATKADGIFLHQGGEGLPSVRKVKISRNSVQNTGRHGIFAAGADVIVEQNTINVCSGAGVYAIAGVLVIDNVISNAAPGILVDNGQQRDIRGNRLSNDNRILFVNSDGSTFTVRVEDNENPLSQ